MRCALVALACVAALTAVGPASTAPDAGGGGCDSRCGRLYVAPTGANGSRWTHLAGTYDGSTLRLYVDGAEVASRAAPGGLAASDGPLRIGGNGLWSEWFRGSIDDVRVYARALSAAEVRQDMAAGVGSAPPRPGLAAAYSFDAPGSAPDVSGRGHTGAVSGATWTSAGRFGGALVFDGIDDWVSVEDADGLDLGDAATFEAWAKPAEPGGWRTVLLKERSDTLAYALYANTGAPGREDVPSAHAFVGGADLSARGKTRLPLNRCTDREAPCRTFDHAYRTALPGQTVEVAGGRYPAQTLDRDTRKASGADVSFVAARNARPRIAGLSVHASHVSFERLTIDGDWSTYDETDDVTFRELTVNGAIFIQSSSNIRVLGGSVGGIRDYMPQFGSWPPGTRIKNILVDGVRFHDIRRTSGDVHIECLLIGGGLGVTIRNSRFEDCSVFDLSIGEFNGSGPPERFVIENNFFGASDGFYSLHFNTNTSALRNVLVRNNSSAQRFYHGNLIGTLDRVRFVANVAPLADGDCDPRIGYRRNVWNGGTCAASDVDAPGGFVDAGSGDLHLRKTAAAIGRGDPASYPSRDIDGDVRPLGGAPDAGADERP